MCTLEKVPIAPEKNVYSVALGWEVQYLLSTLGLMSFKADVSLLTFCLDDLFIGVCGVLTSLTIIVWLFFSLDLLIITLYILMLLD